MRAIRKLDSSHEVCAHTCLPLKQGRSRLKLHGTLASLPWSPWHVLQPKLSALSGSTCSVTQLHPRVKAATANGKAQLLGTEPAQTRNSIWMGWCLTRAGTATAYTMIHWVPNPAPLAPGLFYSGCEGVNTGRGESTHLQGTEPA